MTVGASSRHLDTCSRTGEFDAIALMLVLMPARADPELESAAGHVIDGDRHLGEHRRVAVGDRTDQATDPRIVGQRGHAANIVQPSKVSCSGSTSP